MLIFLWIALDITTGASKITNIEIDKESANSILSRSKQAGFGWFGSNFEKECAEQKVCNPEEYLEWAENGDGLIREKIKDTNFQTYFRTKYQECSLPCCHENLKPETLLNNIVSDDAVQSSIEYVPSGIHCSVANLTVPQFGFVGAGPCDEGNFCRYNLTPVQVGNCEVCPAAGENCDSVPGIHTVHDYKGCCNSCPDAVCDVAAFIQDLRKEIKQNRPCNWERPVAKWNTVLSIPLLDSVDIDEFLIWIDQVFEDTRNWPGFHSVDFNIQRKDLSRGILKNTVMLYMKWDSKQNARGHLRFRFMTGLYTLVSGRWTDIPGDGLDPVENLKHIKGGLFESQDATQGLGLE